MRHTLESRMAGWFAMSDDIWLRHANPWSVYTRTTVLPFLVIAIWSRVWLGWWAIIPISAAVAWTWLNPRLFSKPRSTHNWASKAVLGERVWLNRRNIVVPKHHRIMPNILSGLTTLGLPFLVWGLWKLNVWPLLFGVVLMNAGKFWFLDRMVWIYEEMKDSHPEYKSWLYP